MAETRGGGRFRPESDVDLREHLRQVIRTMHLPGEEVNVDVNDGTVAIRGQIQTAEDRARILDAVRQVAGVSRIEDYMHTPGTPPPNKAPVTGTT
jgi:osmotically-inducible protein OsmY